MAVHNVTINWDEVNSLTERAYVPGIEEQVYGDNAFYMRVPKKGLSGGTFISRGLFYQEGPGGPYSGTEALDGSEVDQHTVANFAWKFYFASMAYRNQDKLMNSGPTALADHIASSVMYARETLQNHLGTGLHSDGSANTKHITGLRAAVTGSGTTYGGISKTTNAWWRATVDSTTTTLTIPAMRTMKGTITFKQKRPTMGLTTDAIYNIYYGLLQPQQRFMDPGLASGGFDNVVFERMPLVVDDHCPANYLYMLRPEDFDLCYHTAENFRFRPFMEPVYQPQVRVAYFLWAGNLTCKSCRSQGVFTGITA